MTRVESPKTQSLRTLARVVIVATVLVATAAAVAGCGQRGPLYYPDTNNPDRRR